jgi:hypothetical protein
MHYHPEMKTTIAAGIVLSLPGRAGCRRPMAGFALDVWFRRAA